MRLKQYLKLVRRGLPELVGHELVGQAPFYEEWAGNYTMYDTELDMFVNPTRKEWGEVMKIGKGNVRGYFNTKNGHMIIWRGDFSHENLYKEVVAKASRAIKATSQMMHILVDAGGAIAGKNVGMIQTWGLQNDDFNWNDARKLKKAVVKVYAPARDYEIWFDDEVGDQEK